MDNNGFLEFEVKKEAGGKTSYFLRPLKSWRATVLDLVKQVVQKAVRGEIKLPPVPKSTPRKLIHYGENFISGRESHGLHDVPWTALSIAKYLDALDNGGGKRPKASEEILCAVALLEAEALRDEDPTQRGALGNGLNAEQICTTFSKKDTLRLVRRLEQERRPRKKK